MTTPPGELDPWDGPAFTATRGAEWELVAETAGGAPPSIYGAECLTCPEACRMDGDARPVQAWTIDHTRDRPHHRQYLLTIQRHGRVLPVSREEWVPAPVAPPVEPHSHARPRRVRPCRAYATRALAALGRLAGPLLIATLSAGCGLVIGIASTTGRG